MGLGEGARPGGGEGGAAARGGEWRSDAAGAAAGGRRSPSREAPNRGRHYAPAARQDSFCQHGWKLFLLLCPRVLLRASCTAAFAPDPGPHGALDTGRSWAGDLHRGDTDMLASPISLCLFLLVSYKPWALGVSWWRI